MTKGNSHNLPEQKKPATRQQENVRTQVVRESTSTANKQSAPTTRQTVQRQKQTKTVQKKTTNQSIVNKTSSRKVARNEAETLRCVWWDFHGDYLSAFVSVYRDSQMMKKAALPTMIFLD